MAEIRAPEKIIKTKEEVMKKGEMRNFIVKVREGVLEMMIRHKKMNKIIKEQQEGMIKVLKVIEKLKNL